MQLYDPLCRFKCCKKYLLKEFLCCWDSERHVLWCCIYCLTLITVEAEFGIPPRVKCILSLKHLFRAENCLKLSILRTHCCNVTKGEGIEMMTWGRALPRPEWHCNMCTGRMIWRLYPPQHLSKLDRVCQEHLLDLFLCIVQLLIPWTIVGCWNILNIKIYPKSPKRENTKNLWTLSEEWEESLDSTHELQTHVISHSSCLS